MRDWRAVQKFVVFTRAGAAAAAQADLENPTGRFRCMIAWLTAVPASNEARKRAEALRGSLLAAERELSSAMFGIMQNGGWMMGPIWICGAVALGLFLIDGFIYIGLRLSKKIFERYFYVDESGIGRRR